MRLVYLIMNPGSRGGKSRKKFNRIFQLLDQANVSYEYKITNSIIDAYSYSVEANRKDYDIIVAVGGDGTINAVLNGFYRFIYFYWDIITFAKIRTCSCIYYTHFSFGD